jgi:hypothetical protein
VRSKMRGQRRGAGLGWVSFRFMSSSDKGPSEVEKLGAEMREQRPYSAVRITRSGIRTPSVRVTCSWSVSTSPSPTSRRENGPPAQLFSADKALDPCEGNEPSPADHHKSGGTSNLRHSRPDPLTFFRLDIQPHLPHLRILLLPIFTIRTASVAVAVHPAH